MKLILTCRECGHRERGDSERELMNRIKMWNHVERAHADAHFKPSQLHLVVREDSEAAIQREAYLLEASY